MSGVPPGTSRFISALFLLLEESVRNPEVAACIQWLPAGNGFRIPADAEGQFLKQFLPRLCRSHSMCSFVRQSNSYGFSKASPGLIEFVHTVFNRAHPELLPTIKRRQPAKKRTKEPKAPEFAAPTPAPAAAPAAVAPPSVPALPPAPLSAAPAVLSVPAKNPSPISTKAVGFMMHSLDLCRSVLQAASNADALIPPDTKDTSMQTVRLQLQNLKAHVATFLQHQSAALVPEATADALKVQPEETTCCQTADMIMSLETTVRGFESDTTSGVSSGVSTIGVKDMPTADHDVGFPTPEVSSEDTNLEDFLAMMQLPEDDLLAF